MFEFLPSWVGILGGTIAGIVAIGFAAINAYDTGLKKQRQEKDEISSEVVDLLKESVDVLEKKVKALETMNIENGKEMSRLRGENETLLKILQGRDETYLRFQSEGFAAFKRIESFGGSLESLIKTLKPVTA